MGMNVNVNLKRFGDRYYAGINKPGARESSHETPLQALRRWIHVVGLDIRRYQEGEITFEQLSERTGISELDLLHIVEVETLLPPLTSGSGKNTLN